MPAIISTICIDIYLSLLMLQLSGVLSGTDQVRLYILIFLVLESVALMIFKPVPVQNQKVKINELTAISIIYLGFIFLYNVFVSLSTSSLLQTVFFSLCLIVIQISYKRIDNPNIFDKILNIQFYFTFVFVACFFITQIKGDDEYRNAINTIYYLLFSFPFVLLNKNKVKRNIGVIAIILCTLWSMKRTPIIVIGIIFVYLLSKGKKYSYSKVVVIILRTMAVIAVAFFANMVFKHYFDIDFISRMMSITETGGSGRENLITETIEILRRNSAKEWLIGHDLKPTSSEFALGAHNDFLEVLYRSGIVGFALYISYYLKIFKYAKVSHGGSKTMLHIILILLIIVSLVSQLFYLPSYIALIAMSCNFAIYSDRMNRRSV